MTPIAQTRRFPIVPIDMAYPPQEAFGLMDAHVQEVFGVRANVDMTVLANLWSQGLLFAGGAFDEGDLVGYALAAHGMSVADKGAIYAKALGIYVAPAYRRTHIARDLMAFIEDTARERGYRGVDWQAPVGSRFDRMLTALRYERTDNLYRRTFGGDRGGDSGGGGPGGGSDRLLGE